MPWDEWHENLCKDLQIRRSSRELHLSQSVAFTCYTAQCLFLCLMGKRLDEPSAFGYFSDK